MKSWKKGLVKERHSQLFYFIFPKKQKQQKKLEKQEMVIQKKLFTRGRGMLHPSLGLGGRRVDLAGGGVSRPTDKLDSGELMGVSVTEEISRQESALTL